MAVYVKQDTLVRVYDGDECIYSHQYAAPRSVSLSPTLYTRLDDCHGAGNCCRVPFDLVYTEYDRDRIINYDHVSNAETFGQNSADGFARFRDDLLGCLVPLRVDISYAHPTATYVHQQSGQICQSTVHRATTIWVQRNTEKFHMTGVKSCPYLVVGQDRHFCGVHPFKPLHCWYPHMTVRATAPRNPGDKSSVSIGRMQYGRNHNFGCPVLFTDVAAEQPNTLFEDVGTQGESYFKEQYQADYDKLEWTALSAASVGLGRSICVAGEIHELFSNAREQMRGYIASGKPNQITLWRNERNES